MKILNSCGAGQAYFIDSLAVNSDTFCVNLAVAFPNKKNEKKKNIENWRYFSNHRNL